VKVVFFLGGKDMKKINVLLAMAALAILSFALIGCDDGDDENFTPPGEEAKVNPLITEYLNELTPYKTIDLAAGGTYTIGEAYGHTDPTNGGYLDWQSKVGINPDGQKFTAGDFIAVTVSGTPKKDIKKIGFAIVDTTPEASYWTALHVNENGWLFFDGTDATNPSGLNANTEFEGSGVFAIITTATNTTADANSFILDCKGFIEVNDEPTTEVNVSGQPEFYAFTVKVYKLNQAQYDAIQAL
jgi:hypothetical protein